jgi:hypothetical protein
MIVPSRFVVIPHPGFFSYHFTLFSFFSSLRAVAIVVLFVYSALLKVRHVRRQIKRFKPS